MTGIDTNIDPAMSVWTFGHTPHAVAISMIY
jgi:hypothetical protein